ncbi:MAG: HD domain-containing phosphohydrolase, partial [bacterium]|nr:HD domain-containing phosphohydrolase [bacterium]
KEGTANQPQAQAQQAKEGTASQPQNQAQLAKDTTLKQLQVLAQQAKTPAVQTQPQAQQPKEINLQQLQAQIQQAKAPAAKPAPEQAQQSKEPVARQQQSPAQAQLAKDTTLKQLQVLAQQAKAPATQAQQAKAPAAQTQPQAQAQAQQAKAPAAQTQPQAQAQAQQAKAPTAQTQPQAQAQTPAQAPLQQFEDLKAFSNSFELKAPNAAAKETAAPLTSSVSSVSAGTGSAQNIAPVSGFSTAATAEPSAAISTPAAPVPSDSQPTNAAVASKNGNPAPASPAASQKAPTHDGIDKASLQLRQEASIKADSTAAAPKVMRTGVAQSVAASTTPNKTIENASKQADSRFTAQLQGLKADGSFKSEALSSAKNSGAAAPAGDKAAAGAGAAKAASGTDNVFAGSRAQNKEQIIEINGEGDNRELYEMLAQAKKEINSSFDQTAARINSSVLEQLQKQNASSGETSSKTAAGAKGGSSAAETPASAAAATATADSDGFVGLTLRSLTVDGKPMVMGSSQQQKAALGGAAAQQASGTATKEQLAQQVQLKAATDISAPSTAQADKQMQAAQAAGIRTPQEKLENKRTGTSAAKTLRASSEQGKATGTVSKDTSASKPVLLNEELNRNQMVTSVMGRRDSRGAVKEIYGFASANAADEKASGQAKQQKRSATPENGAKQVKMAISGEGEKGDATWSGDASLKLPGKAVSSKKPAATASGQKTAQAENAKANSKATEKDGILSGIWSKVTQKIKAVGNKDQSVSVAATSATDNASPLSGLANTVRKAASAVKNIAAQTFGLGAKETKTAAASTANAQVNGKISVQNDGETSVLSTSSTASAKGAISSAVSSIGKAVTKGVQKVASVLHLPNYEKTSSAQTKDGKASSIWAKTTQKISLQSIQQNGESTASAASDSGSWLSGVGTALGNTFRKAASAIKNIAIQTFGIGPKEDSSSTVGTLSTNSLEGASIQSHSESGKFGLSHIADTISSKFASFGKAVSKGVQTVADALHLPGHDQANSTQSADGNGSIWSKLTQKITSPFSQDHTIASASSTADSAESNTLGSTFRKAVTAIKGIASKLLGIDSKADTGKAETANASATAQPETSSLGSRLGSAIADTAKNLMQSTLIKGQDIADSATGSVSSALKNAEPSSASSLSKTAGNASAYSSLNSSSSSSAGLSSPVLMEPISPSNDAKAKADFTGTGQNAAEDDGFIQVSSSRQRGNTYGIDGSRIRLDSSGNQYINSAAPVSVSIPNAIDISVSYVPYGDYAAGVLALTDLDSRLASGVPEGGRPVTSQIPAYQPVLDVLYMSKTRQSVDQSSSAIKTVLTGSVGSMSTQEYTSVFSQELANANSQNFKESGLSGQKTETAAYKVLKEAKSLTLHSESKSSSSSSSSNQQRISSSIQQEALMGQMGKTGSEENRQQNRISGYKSNYSTHGITSAQAISGKNNRGQNGQQQGQQGQQRGQEQAERTLQEQSESARSSQKGGQGKQDQNAAANRAQSSAQLYKAQKANLKNEALRIMLSKLQGQDGQANLQTIARFSELTPIRNLMKRLYDKERLEEMNEDEAMAETLLLFRITDPATYENSTNVLNYALDMAGELGLQGDAQLSRELQGGAMLKDIGELGIYLFQQDDDSIDNLSGFLRSKEMRQAAMLHNIGETQIPDSIKFKTTPLTDEEYEILKLHPIIGAEMIYPIESLRYLCPTIRGHHERWDGKGYPDGLKMRDIPLAARILAIADTFEAIMSTRPDKSGIDAQVARQIINAGRGTYFDPQCVDAFERMIERRFPRQSGRNALTPSERNMLDTTFVLQEQTAISMPAAKAVRETAAYPGISALIPTELEQTSVSLPKARALSETMFSESQDEFRPAELAVTSMSVPRAKALGETAVNVEKSGLRATELAVTSMSAPRAKALGETAVNAEKSGLRATEVAVTSMSAPRAKAVSETAVNAEKSGLRATEVAVTSMSAPRAKAVSETAVSTQQATPIDIVNEFFTDWD